MPRKRKQEDSQTKKNRRTRRSATPETKSAETPSVVETAEAIETQSESSENVEPSIETLKTPVEVVETLTETTTDEVSAELMAAKTDLTPQAESQTRDTATMLGLRRMRDTARCCCGCNQVLSSPKKHFAQGHDGRARSIAYRILRREMEPQDAPPELIWRHMEIKFIMLSPQFRPVVAAWREICGLTPTNAVE